MKYAELAIQFFKYYLFLTCNVSTGNEDIYKLYIKK